MLDVGESGDGDEGSDESERTGQGILMGRARAVELEAAFAG